MPITFPEFLTTLAARNTSMPAPDPKSTTVSPSLIKANFVGVPQPAPRIESTGIDFSSLASYPTSSETCEGDGAGWRTVLFFPEQQPPSFPKPTEGPQQESPTRCYLSISFLYFFLYFQRFIHAICLLEKLFKLSREAR